MCGRFYAGEELIRQLERDFPWLLGKLSPGDVFPSRQAAVLISGSSPDGKAAENSRSVGCRDGLTARLMTWGYPMSSGSRLTINARAETISVRPMFREDYAFRRCAVPAEKFYEWKRTGTDRVKYEFRPSEETDRRLYLAGIFHRDQSDEAGGRFVVITTKANASMAPIHDRMPVLMGREEIRDWLNSPEDSQRILERVPRMLIPQKTPVEYEQLSLFELPEK